MYVYCTTTPNIYTGYENKGKEEVNGNAFGARDDLSILKSQHQEIYFPQHWFILIGNIYDVSDITSKIIKV